MKSCENCPLLQENPDLDCAMNIQTCTYAEEVFQVNDVVIIKMGNSEVKGQRGIISEIVPSKSQPGQMLYKVKIPYLRIITECFKDELGLFGRPIGKR